MKFFEDNGSIKISDILLDDDNGFNTRLKIKKYVYLLNIFGLI